MPTGRPCILCGACTDACPALALEMSGKEWPMDELMAEVEKERGVMQDSGGGVTLSGGEPLLHPEYTLDLLEELGLRGFHRAVDTTLFASPGTVRAVAEACELFLVDLKVMDADVHRRYTGVSNEGILENLRMVASIGTPCFIRIPLIAEVNASEENIAATVDFLRSLDRPPVEVDLLPYHDIGKGKHERMGTVYNPENLPLSAPSQQEQERCVKQLTEAGLTVRIGG